MKDALDFDSTARHDKYSAGKREMISYSQLDDRIENEENCNARAVYIAEPIVFQA